MEYLIIASQISPHTNRKLKITDKKIYDVSKFAFLAAYCRGSKVFLFRFKLAKTFVLQTTFIVLNLVT